MKIKKNKLFSISAFSILVLTICSMLFVTYASNNDDSKKFGVEINVKNKPFYFPAATEKEVITGLIRVGDSKNASSEDISGLKIAPEMEKGKVRVRVFAIYGDIRGIKSCDDLDTVKTKFIGSKILDKDGILNLSEFAQLKPNENNETFNLKIVELKKRFNEIYKKVSNRMQTSGCATCGDLQCCPNPGKCRGCGDCGTVCKEEPPHTPGDPGEPEPGDSPVGK